MDLVAALARARWARPGDLADAVEQLAVEAVLAQAEECRPLDDLEDELFRFARIVAGDAGLRRRLLQPDRGPPTASASCWPRLLARPRSTRESLG